MAEYQPTAEELEAARRYNRTFLGQVEQGQGHELAAILSGIQQLVKRGPAYRNLQRLRELEGREGQPGLVQQARTRAQTEQEQEGRLRRGVLSEQIAQAHSATTGNIQANQLAEALRPFTLRGTEADTRTKEMKAEEESYLGPLRQAGAVQSLEAGDVGIQGARAGIEQGKETAARASREEASRNLGQIVETIAKIAGPGGLGFTELTPDGRTVLSSLGKQLLPVLQQQADLAKMPFDFSGLAGPPQRPGVDPAAAAALRTETDRQRQPRAVPPKLSWDEQKKQPIKVKPGDAQWFGPTQDLLFPGSRFPMATKLNRANELQQQIASGKLQGTDLLYAINELARLLGDLNIDESQLGSYE